MLVMDGDPVEPNDMVWDSRDQNGIVQSVYADYFTAKFGRRTRRITPAGVMDGRTQRTVYWAPNNFFIPRKNPALYRKQRHAAMQIMQILSDVSGLAPMAEPTDDA